MADIIAICNQKGGVGKTTVTLNLGVALALRGKKILLVDIDPQANLTSSLGINPRLLNKHLYHALVLDYPIHKIIKRTSVKNLFILPTNFDLSGANVELAHVKNKEKSLLKLLGGIESEFDFILVDFPPSLNTLSIAGLYAADWVLIPVQAEYFAMEGLAQLLEVVDLINQSLEGQNKELKILGMVLTMVEFRKKLNRQVLKDVGANFPEYVFETIIPRNIALAEAVSFGKSIFDYDSENSITLNFHNLAEEFLQKINKSWLNSHLEGAWPR